MKLTAALIEPSSLLQDPRVTQTRITHQIAAELKVRPAQVQTAVALLDGGATVPFIARYRKEATEGLDDVQLRELEARLAYLRELEERRVAVLRSVAEQGKLTPELAAALDAAPTKQELEDLYAPFKPKRRTKGLIAREAGLEPLADRLFADPSLDPLAEAVALRQCRSRLRRCAAVLDGVRDLLSERWAEEPALVGALREWLWSRRPVRIEPGRRGKDENAPEVSKFRDYFDYAEPIARVPSHRALAVFRGRTLEMLDARLAVDEELQPGQASLAEGRIARHLRLEPRRPPRRRSAAQVRVVDLEGQAVAQPRARPVRAPARVRRERRDQGLRRQPARPAAGRTGRQARDDGAGPRHPHRRQGGGGDATGRVLDTATVYPHEPRRDWDGSLHALGKLVATHGVT